MERAAAQALLAAIAALVLAAAAAQTGISWVLLNFTFERFAMENPP